MSLIYRSIRPASRLRPAAAAGMAIASRAVRAKHTLPDLPYDYAALEPAISGKIMELHHSKHHQTYVNSLNDAEEKHATAVHNKDVQQQINLQPLLKFHGGGHINHSLFWQNLAPPKSGGGAPPIGPLADGINLTWGNYEEFKKIFNASLAGIQGSGWSWLVKDNDTKALQIISLPNQDPVVGKYTPLLGIDAWEHAYYLDYQNRKAEYFSAIWNVINWRAAEQRFKP